MQITIARTMTVADGGVSRQFIKGKSYDVSEDTRRRLKRAGAIALDAKTASPAPAIPAEDLDAMTVAALRDHAAAMGFDLGEATKKAEIIAAIEASVMRDKPMESIG